MEDPEEEDITIIHITGITPVVEDIEVEEEGDTMDRKDRNDPCPEGPEVTIIIIPVADPESPLLMEMDQCLRGISPCLLPPRSLR